MSQASVAAGSGTPATAARTVDYDVHGIVGIRLLNPSQADESTVARQLGTLRTPLTREPDVVVRFVDDLPVRGLHWVEFGASGFTEDGFFVVRSGKQAARVRIAFEDVGGRCEIVCQHGLRAVPLLLAMVNVLALQRGCVALHASAFVYEGTGVLVTGWAKGGKTEALLAFTARGAEYVGDEWVILAGDGNAMYGIPEFIRLQDWHLDALPDVRRRVPVARRLLFKGVRLLEAAHRGLADGRVGELLPMRTLGAALPALQRQLNVQRDPREVFPRWWSAGAARPDRLVLMVSHDDPATRVEPIAPEEVAARMTASIQYELMPLHAAYLGYLFAFPGRRSHLLDRVPQLQASLVARALAGKEAYLVRHPYPCAVGDLFEAMRAGCRIGDGWSERRTQAAMAAAATGGRGTPRWGTGIA